jgi:hypothetical protein
MAAQLQPQRSRLTAPTHASGPEFRRWTLDAEHAMCFHSTAFLMQILAEPSPVLWTLQNTATTPSCSATAIPSRGREQP